MQVSEGLAGFPKLKQQTSDLRAKLMEEKYG